MEYSGLFINLDGEDIGFCRKLIFSKTTNLDQNCFSPCHTKYSGFSDLKLTFNLLLLIITIIVFAMINKTECFNVLAKCYACK